MVPALTVQHRHSSDPAHLYLSLGCFAKIILSSFRKLTKVIHHNPHNSTKLESNFKVFVPVFKKVL